MSALVVALCTAQVESQPPTAPRVAVVIGNGAYATMPLLNTANDAKAVASALRDAGFSVIELRDGTLAQMQDAVNRAASLLRGRSGVGLFYFAGHGLQLDWHNYLVPVDAHLSNAAEVRATAFSLQLVIDAFRIAGNRVSILILDACRDNPLVDGTGGRGLAQMDAPPGTLLAYATAPGRVAEDGNAIDGYGPYAHFLVREMRRSATKVEDVFKRVRFQVRQQSEGRQVPWESTRLEDDFYFDPGVRVTTLDEDERARELSAQMARGRAEWDRIRRSVNPDDFSAFLVRNATGEYVEAAELRIRELRQLIARAKPGEPIELTDARNRYATGDTFTYVSVDGFTGHETTMTWRVNFADNKRVEFNDGVVLTQLGATMRDNRGFWYDPPRLDMVPALEAGKTWHSEFRTWRGQSSAGSGWSDHSVVAQESMTVPAGTFETFRIESSGEAAQIGLTTYTGTAWADIKTLRLVRLDMVIRNRGRIDQFFSLRLVSQKRAPRWSDP